MKNINKILPLQIYLTAVLYVGQMGFAQDTWVPQTSGTSEDLHSVHFVDSDQVAFPFSTVKNTRLERFMDAFETLGIPVYAT